VLIIFTPARAGIEQTDYKRCLDRCFFNGIVVSVWSWGIVLLFNTNGSCQRQRWG